MKETQSEWAARMFVCFEDWRALEICYHGGLSPEQIEAARAQSWRMKDAIEADNRAYGRPEFGGRPDYEETLDAPSVPLVDTEEEVLTCLI